MPNSLKKEIKTIKENNQTYITFAAAHQCRSQLAPHDTVAVAQNAVQAHFADVEKEAEAQNVLNGIESQGFESEIMPNTAAGKFPVLDAVKGPFPTLRYVIVGPSTASDPLVTVVLSIIRKVLNFITSNPSSNFLRFLSLLDINHNTLIPSYFNDQHLLIHLALILHPQIGGADALKNLGLTI